MQIFLPKTPEMEKNVSRLITKRLSIELTTTYGRKYFQEKAEKRLECKSIERDYYQSVRP